MCFNNALILVRFIRILFEPAALPDIVSFSVSFGNYCIRIRNSPVTLSQYLSGYKWVCMEIGGKLPKLRNLCTSHFADKLELGRHQESSVTQSLLTQTPCATCWQLQVNQTKHFDSPPREQHWVVIRQLVRL